MFGRKPQDTPAPPVDVPGEGQLKARLVTTEGDIEAELHEQLTPKTVRNFVALAKGTVEWTRPDGGKTTEPLYQDLSFHRVIPEFMVQCGCPEGTGRGGPGWNFPDEIRPELRHDRPGVLSMANAGPGTNGSQFFVTEVATPWLDGKHTVFGRVTKGAELIPKIAAKGNGRTRLTRVEVYRD